jgi:hypothetical protein
MKCKVCGLETNNPKFCGRSCSAKYNNVITKVKPKPVCASCGETIIRGRKYCSNKCQAKLTRSTINEQIVDGTSVNGGQLRRYLIEVHGAKCMICNWSEKNIKTNTVPIEIDHIDGNSYNNILSNVRLLCPNCHAIQPTAKALNKGNGRHSRMVRYKNNKSY